MHIPIVISILVVVVCLIVIGLTSFQLYHREYMNKLTEHHDPTKIALHINQSKYHQDIYFVPIEKWKEHSIEWWRNNYPKEYFVGYYSFSLFYVGQHSPR